MVSGFIRQIKDKKITSEIKYENFKSDKLFISERDNIDTINLSKPSPVL